MNVPSRCVGVRWLRTVSSPRLVLSLWTCDQRQEALLGVYVGPLDGTLNAVELLLEAVCPE